MKSSILVLIAVACLFVFSRLRADEMADIIEHIRAEELRYGHLEFDWHWSNTRVGVGSPETVKKIDINSHVILQDQRFWQQTASSPPTYEPARLETFDGMVTTVLVRPINLLYLDRVQAPVPLVPHLFLLYRTRIGPIFSTYLAEVPTPPRLVQWTVDTATTDIGTLDRVKTVVLDRREFDAKSLERIFHIRVWLAIERNYLPVRVEGFQLNLHEELPSVISVVSELREIAPGTWLPVRGETTLYEPTLLREGKQVADNEQAFYLDDIRLETKYPPEKFQPQLPPGSSYWEVRNGEYTKREARPENAK